MPILILDGGLGTTLSNPPYDHRFTPSQPLWASHFLLTQAGRRILTEVHGKYHKAGADVVSTSTYQASFEGFGKTKRIEESGTVSGVDVNDKQLQDERGCGVKMEEGEGYGEEEAATLMGKGVDVVVDAFASISGTSSPAACLAFQDPSTTPHGEPLNTRGPIAALSLGAYGATLSPSQEYTGKYPTPMSSYEALRDWHGKRLAVFANDSERWNAVDVVAFETLPRIEEIDAVRRVMYDLEQSGRGKPFWISAVFPREGRYDSPTGHNAERVVQAMYEFAEGRTVPWGVGINCTTVGKLERIVLEWENALDELQREADEHGDQWRWPWLVIYPDGTGGDLVYNTTTKEWENLHREDGVSKEPWCEELWRITKVTRARNKWRGLLVGGCCVTGPDDIAGLKACRDRDVPSALYNR
jgi:homocysteine S-methyltransferase